MSDYSDFCAQIAEWANREDWSPNLVQSFVRMAEQKLNAELRIGRMINAVDGLITARCAPVPTDWLEFDLVLMADPNPPGGWLPIRYKARDEFFQLPDKWSQNFYTIEGRQVYFGGTPDSTNGVSYRMHYYSMVPVFSDVINSWVYTYYPSIYLSAALMHAYLHAVGEEQTAALAKQLAEDGITKLNAEWRFSRASGSRLTRTRVRSFG